MDEPIITLRCPNCANIFNVELHGGNTFECAYCGAKNAIKREYIYNSKEEAVKIIEELIRRGIIDNKNEVNKQTQNTSHKASEPRKKSVAGRVFLIIGIVYAILGVIYYLVNAIPEIIQNVDETTPTTSYVKIDTGNYGTTPTTGVVNIGKNDEGDVSDPIVCVFPTPVETSEFIPNEVLLVNLKPYTDMPYTEVTYVSSDIFDNHYANGIYSRIEQTDGTCCCTYRINKKFDKFTFTSGILEWGRGQPGEALIRVYGDGVKIYERSLDCTSDSLFQDLDITGVKDLTIEMYGYSEPEVSLTGFTTLYPCIWEPTLYTAR